MKLKERNHNLGLTGEKTVSFFVKFLEETSVILPFIFFYSLGSHPKNKNISKLNIKV